MRKKLCAAGALLLAAVLIGVWLARRDVSSEAEGPRTDAEGVDDWRNVIAYVPLDDRTDNLEDVIYLAEASGYRVVLPEGDVYCTKLDGQVPNSNGTQYGDREALFTWVREMDERGCDLFLLSLDQLFSGGLVHSRFLSRSEPLCFDDGAVMSEEEAFDAFILALAEDPDNRVYLFDSVVRLASTVGYQGFGIEEYYALREYGMVARPALSGEELTLENVFAGYPYAADGATRAEDALGDDTYRSVLTEEILSDYLGVRVRKLRLLDYVISALDGAPHDNIQLLIGIDDSSNADNIQYNELRYIESRLGRGSTLLTGLDSLGRLLVGRIAQESYGRSVRASVRYVGGSQSVPSSEFDRYTLEETVDLHMELFRAVRVPEEEAELQILVMTAPAEPEKAQDYCGELVEKLAYNSERRIPTVLVEASNNAYGETLERLLFEQADLAGLMAFAGKYDQANVTGAAFAMGFSRYLYLSCCEEKEEACDIAQVRQLTNSLVLTYPYILHTRYELNRYIQELGGNYNNILPDEEQDKLIQKELERLFLPACETVCGALKGECVVTSLAPYAERRITGISVTEPYFPWNRTFEVSFTIHVSPLAEAE